MLARERGERAYLVGGAVRDLLLERPVVDVDLAVQGDAAGFSAALASRLSARHEAHARFGTSVLELPGGARLDVAATRRETYLRPGALPDVTIGATIAEDLARRDFTIHALALPLARRPKLIDLFGGVDDLTRRRLAFLHAGSPTDDPTRALRAVRYAGRLGFAVPPDARRQIAAAIRAGAFDAVSGDRLRRELALIVSEPARDRAPRLLASLGVDRAVAPALARAGSGASPRLRRAARLASAAPAARTSWLCYLLAWMALSSARDLAQVADRLSISGRDREALSRWPDTRRRLAAGASALAPSKRRALVAGLGADEVVAAASRLRRADATALLQSFAARGGPGLGISGADLLAAGVGAGPAIGRALEATRAAREDGKIRASEELAFAVAAARRPA